MMKSNIDLTENEMFCRPQTSRAFPIKLFGVFGYTFPWDMMYSLTPDEIEHARFEVVFTGNRSEREEKELCRQEETRDYCDCCGAKLDEIPWDRTYGLCKKCHDYMDKTYGDRYKFPWGEKDEMEAQRGSISLTW